MTRGQTQATGRTEAHRPPALIDGLTPAQRLAHEIVAANPGITIKEVAVRMAVSHASASYHLMSLSRAGFVLQQRDGRELRHFLAVHGSGPAAHLQAMARSPRARSLIEFLLTHPVERLTVRSLARQANLEVGFVRRTLLRLDSWGFVQLERRSYRYSLRVLPALGEAWSPMSGCGTTR